MTAPTADDNANELMHGTDKDGKGWTGRKDPITGKAITAGTDIATGMQAARDALAQSKANAEALARIEAKLSAPSSGVTVGGDVAVTGTLHVEGTGTP